MEGKIKNIKVLPCGSNYPYYTEVEVIEENDSIIYIRDWSKKIKELRYNEKMGFWVPKE